MSFDIEKRAREIFGRALVFDRPNENVTTGAWELARERAIQLAREAADARAEEIASMLETRILELGAPHHSVTISELRAAAMRTRNTIQRPETRERRLETALRQLLDGMSTSSVDHWKQEARRALESK